MAASNRADAVQEPTLGVGGCTPWAHTIGTHSWNLCCWGLRDQATEASQPNSKGAAVQRLADMGAPPRSQEPGARPRGSALLCGGS